MCGIFILIFAPLHYMNLWYYVCITINFDIEKHPLKGHLSDSHYDRFAQERCNSSALAMELHLSCINPLITWFIYLIAEIYSETWFLGHLSAQYSLNIPRCVDNVMQRCFHIIFNYSLRLNFSGKRIYDYAFFMTQTLCLCCLVWYLYPA